MRYVWETISSWAYWRYVLFSLNGAQSVLAIFGAIFLFVEALDFFGFYSRDDYASYAIFLFLALAVIGSVAFRRPIQSTVITFPNTDVSVEVRIGDIFDVTGAVMVSTNTDFESDVAGGKVSPESLQGQFTARYFTGNQTKLIEELESELDKVPGKAPYEIGTTVPIISHGKTFYFTAMAELNEKGNASTTLTGVKQALEGLWKHVREAGELQELAVPLIGTGRGRLRTPRKKMILEIAESFISASKDDKLSDKVIICIRPEDAYEHHINLWDIKDHLKRSLVS